MHLIFRGARAGSVVSGAFVTAMLLGACGQPAPSAPGPAARVAPAIAVSAEVARRGDIQQTLAYSGDIRATDSITITPRGSGRLELLAVKVGSQVKAGDTIAWLDRISAQVQVSQLQVALAAAQARLTTIRSGARTENVASTQASLAQQQLNLDNLRSGGRAEDIQIADAGLATSTAKMATLLNGADASIRQQAQGAVDSDRAALSAAQATFAALGASNAASLKQGRSQIDVLDAQVSSAQAQITSADAALAAIRARGT
jgi:multidrug efflux pump subunit AcrA (membrane-fusion protein)